MVYNILDTVRKKVDRLNKAIEDCDENSILIASETSEWLEKAWFAPTVDLPEGFNIKDYDRYKNKITELSSQFKDKCSCRSK